MTSSAVRLRADSAVRVADYGPGETFGPRTLPNYELLWVLRGSAEWWTDVRDHDGRSLRQETHVLRPGTLALSRRGNRDSYRWADDRWSRHAYVHFALDDPGPLGPPAGWPAVRSMSDPGVLDGLCQYLLDLAGGGSAAGRERSDRLVAAVLDVFVAPRAGSGPAVLPGGLQNVAEHVAAAWAAGGMRIVPVGEVAAATHLSAGHLHRLFRAAFDCGPARAFDLIRLATAASALQRSNRSISAVAARCGYSNRYHFSRRFTQAYGVPPGVFRREHRLSDPLWPVRDAGLLPLLRVLRASEGG